MLIKCLFLSCIEYTSNTGSVVSLPTIFLKEIYILFGELYCTLTTFGFRRLPLQWMRSNVDGRIPSILLGGKSTAPRPAVYGVPQGSVLGPLLFTLYTANIGKVIQQYGQSHHIYADDNQLYSPCDQHECSALQSRMITCIAPIGE